MTQTTHVESKAGQFEIVVKSLERFNVQFIENGNFKVLFTMKIKNRNLRVIMVTEISLKF